jgi:hypothetical protein
MTFEKKSKKRKQFDPSVNKSSNTSNTNRDKQKAKNTSQTVDANDINSPTVKMMKNGMQKHKKRTYIIKS